MVKLNYDKSLWLILENDKRNRKKILDFLMSFPSELYNDFVKVIAEPQNSKRYGTMKICGVVYCYEFDIRNNKLFLSKYYERDAEKQDVFVMTLYPYREDVELNKSVSLGSVAYQLKVSDTHSIFDCDKVSYNIHRKSNAIYFVRTREDFCLFPKTKTKFSFDDVPSQYDIKSFYNKDVKTRKRKKTYEHR